MTGPSLRPPRPPDERRPAERRPEPPGSGARARTSAGVYLIRIGAEETQTARRVTVLSLYTSEPERSERPLGLPPTMRTLVFTALAATAFGCDSQTADDKPLDLNDALLFAWVGGPIDSLHIASLHGGGSRSVRPGEGEYGIDEFLSSGEASGGGRASSRWRGSAS